MFSMDHQHKQKRTDIPVRIRSKCYAYPCSLIFGYNRYIG